jgi:hypothetical protein
MECLDCNRPFNSKLGLARHISQAHDQKSYFDRHCASERDGSCLECGDPTTFMGPTVGYRRYCQSKACSGTGHRKRLRADPEKFQRFREKVSQNQTVVWGQRDQETLQDIGSKITATSKRNASQLTEEQRRERYSRYHKCDQETIARLNERGTEHLMSLIRSGKTGWGMAHRGRFTPTNPHKYKGNIHTIVWRSRWELVVMTKFDAHPDILEWSSEELVIPYADRSTGKFRRYYPDFHVKLKTKSGETQIMVIEVKPKKETAPPVKAGKKTQRYVTEALTYAKNLSKWEAARTFCEARGWKFVIWTEDHLGLPL